LNSAGYAIHSAVFTRFEIQKIAATLAALPLQRSRAGARHVLGFAEVESLARDARLVSIASSWLQGVALPFRATLFEKTCAANWLVAWHQDTALPLERRADVSGWGPWSEKYGITYAHAPGSALAGIIALRVHLDDSTPANGSLRILPGTHEMGVLTDAQVQAWSKSATAVDCHLAAGGVLAMRPLLIHASSKSSSDAPRRVLHVEYSVSRDVAPGLRLRAA
jgi:ectoine hydroxylase-related dioxygenase (phytanoyl-CoA dioxygenase family)